MCILDLSLYNSVSVSTIRADQGNINDYQFTYDRFGKSVNNIKHDVSVQASYGTGSYITFSKMYDELQKKW